MGGVFDICRTFWFFNFQNQIQQEKLIFSRNRLPWQHAWKILKCLRIRLQSYTHTAYLDIKQFVKMTPSVQFFFWGGEGKTCNFALPKFCMFDLWPHLICIYVSIWMWKYHFLKVHLICFVLIYNNPMYKYINSLNLVIQNISPKWP